MSITTETLKKIGNFSFDITKGNPLPEDFKEARAAQPARTPYNEFFASAEDKDELFIPTRFYTAPESEGGRGVEKAKATPAYMKSKVRDALKRWIEGDKEGRSNRRLQIITRDPGQLKADGITAYEEAGISVYMRIENGPSAKAPEPAPAPAADPAKASGKTTKAKAS